MCLNHVKLSVECPKTKMWGWNLQKIVDYRTIILYSSAPLFHLGSSACRVCPAAVVNFDNRHSPCGWPWVNGPLSFPCLMRVICSPSVFPTVCFSTAALPNEILTQFQIRAQIFRYAVNRPTRIQ